MSEYDISHLKPHTVIYIIPPDAKKNRGELKCHVMVSYSDHCYTKAVGDATQREFDLTRYELSKNLPEIISGLMSRKCSFALDRNFFTVESKERGEYEIYFSVYKNSFGKMALRVQSAYIRDKERLLGRAKWRTINFSTILSNVLYNKPMRPPR